MITSGLFGARLSSQVSVGRQDRTAAADLSRPDRRRPGRAVQPAADRGNDARPRPASSPGDIDELVRQQTASGSGWPCASTNLRHPDDDPGVGANQAALTGHRRNDPAVGGDSAVGRASSTVS